MLLLEDGSGFVYGRYDECWPKDDYGAYTGKEGLRRPSPKVLDADNVEIKVGDTVWSLSTEEKLEVKEVYENGNIRAINESGLSNWYEREDITHKEPDTIKKLLHDMAFARECTFKDDDSINRTLYDFEKRLRTIMDSDL